MAKTGELYDRDFVRWTEEQAAALRRAKSSNLPLDWDNLAEEIESLGKSDRRELRSRIRRILHHLLKIEVSPAMEPQAGWRSTVRSARAEIRTVLGDSPSLRRQVAPTIAEELRVAVQMAEDDLAWHGEAVDGIRARVEIGGYTADQVLGDWFPDRPV
jgi:hypothetical protein